MTQSYPPNYPSHFYEWTCWAVVSVRRKRKEQKSRMPHCDSPLLMNHFSLQMAHPSPGCSSCRSGLSKRFIITFIFFMLVLGPLKSKNSHVETWITGSYCCWMLMALERHFPRGCSWGLTGLFFCFFFPLSLLSQEKEEKASQESSEEEEEEEEDQ